MSKPLLICIAVFCVTAALCAQVRAGEDGIPVLREAQEFGDNAVAVEVYLMDNILEARITARMHGTKPKVYNAIVVGSGLGRLSFESKEVLLASIADEDEEPYLTKDKSRGIISFREKEKAKFARGTLTRELVQFVIPEDRVRKGKKYRLWIQIESLQRGGKYKTYKFDLEKFAELLLEKNIEKRREILAQE